jgi:hypothetical protein
MDDLTAHALRGFTFPLRHPVIFGKLLVKCKRSFDKTVSATTVLIIAVALFAVAYFLKLRRLEDLRRLAEWGIRPRRLRATLPQ